jgi:hypothetical protein
MFPREIGDLAVSVDLRAGRGEVWGGATGGATAVRPAISAAVRICEPAGREGAVNGETPGSGLGAAHRGRAGLVSAESFGVAPAGAGDSVGAEPPGAADNPGPGEPTGADCGGADGTAPVDAAGEPAENDTGAGGGGDGAAAAGGVDVAGWLGVVDPGEAERVAPVDDCGVRDCGADAGEAERVAPVDDCRVDDCGDGCGDGCGAAAAGDAGVDSGPGVGATPFSDVGGAALLALAGLAAPVVTGRGAVPDGAAWPGAARRAPLPCSVESAAPGVS